MDFNLKKKRGRKTKLCSKCKINKEGSNFGLKIRNKDGLDTICSDCHKKERLYNKLVIENQIRVSENQYEIKFKEKSINQNHHFEELSSSMHGFFKVYKYTGEMEIPIILNNIVDFLDSIKTSQSFILDFELGYEYSNLNVFYIFIRLF